MSFSCQLFDYRLAVFNFVLLVEGALSPSTGSGLAAPVRGLTPGLRLSKEYGQRTPSVDSNISVGAGGTFFSSAEYNRHQNTNQLTPQQYQSWMTIGQQRDNAKLFITVNV